MKLNFISRKLREQPQQHLDGEETMHVVIAGAGIGGLCLAQGLTRSGIDVTVLEANATLVRSGYRLHMNADGGEALHSTLPPAAFALYQATSRKSPRRELLTFIDQHGVEVGTRPHIGPPNDPDMPHTAVNRRTLAQIMLDGIHERVRFSSRVTGYLAHSDRVTVSLESGETIDADVLVGADGINSRIREQLLGAPDVVDLGVANLYGRAALPQSLSETLPDTLSDGFVFATDSAGRFLTFGEWLPRRAIVEAVADLLPSAEIDPVDPYMQVTLVVPPAGPISYPGDIQTATGPEIREFWLDGLRDWDPALQSVVAAIDPDSIFTTRMRGIRPTEPWEPSRVTVLGDAIHAMPPSFGAGANTALKDAATLARHLGNAGEGESGLIRAIGDFENEMRSYAYPILKMSLDPKSFDAD
jgi:salicylate hydroxylase